MIITAIYHEKQTIFSLIYHEIPTILGILYHEIPTNKRDFTHKNRRYLSKSVY